MINKNNLHKFFANWDFLHRSERIQDRDDEDDGINKYSLTLPKNRADWFQRYLTYNGTAYTTADNGDEVKFLITCTPEDAATIVENVRHCLTPDTIEADGLKWTIIDHPQNTAKMGNKLSDKLNDNQNLYAGLDYLTEPDGLKRLRLSGLAKLTNWEAVSKVAPRQTLFILRLRIDPPAIICTLENSEKVTFSLSEFRKRYNGSFYWYL